MLTPTDRKGLIVSPEEQSSLLDAICSLGRPIIYGRYARIFDFMFESGVRASELLQCDCGHLDGDLLSLTIIGGPGASDSTDGEGYLVRSGETRRMPLGERALELFEELAQGRPDDAPLLHGRGRDGRMSTDRLYEVWLRGWESSHLRPGLQLPPLTTSTRATFAHRVTSCGVPSEVVSYLLASRNPTDEELFAMRAAIAQLESTRTGSTSP